MIAPMIAVSQVERSQNSSSGSASKMAPARKPPMRAPAMPIRVVMMMPPGCLSGRIALAITPAISPRMMKAMMPMSRLQVGRVHRCAYVPARLARKHGRR
jgi:hypothetical protein